jgi:DNA-binding NtrC family response regulator
MTLNHRVLIVDDDRDICLLLSRLMRGEGLASHVAHDGESALKMVRSQRPDALLLDLKMPGMDGMEVLHRVKELDTNLPVVLITGHADIAGSVAAIKAGAFDYLAKPFEHPEVTRVVRRALAQRAQGQVKAAGPGSAPEADLREMMGPSDAVSRVIQEVEQVTASDFSVVIQGETGSGKELVARAIHRLSRRVAKDFVPVDCGAIPDTLLESELFGYQKGAFTGAVGPKPGKFLAAQGGTLFLDEISNLPLNSQAKLLRALQDRVIYQLGTSKATPTDVRVLAASNQDLQILVESSRMRRDLYFRLNEFTINIPPLRERKEDIPYLAKRFLDITNRELGKNVKSFSESCLEAMFDYSWPGNVRQLRSAIRRAVLLADDLVTDRHLEIKRVSVPGLAFTPKVQGTPWRDLPLKEIVRRSILTVEKEVLAQALKYTGGNKAKAARLLQIDYKTMHTKVRRFGINRDGGQYD